MTSTWGASSQSARLVEQAGSSSRFFDSDSKQYLHYLAMMLHSEPVIDRCIGAIISGSLAKGINVVSESTGRSVTPEFRNFVNKYYAAFAREAIKMFCVLGFAVWRLAKRRIRGKVQFIPEILPLGSFTWSVQTMSKEERARRHVDQLVMYNIQLQGVDCDFHVFEFRKPDLTMQCVSPLSTVIGTYIRLMITRAAKMKCEEWNASIKLSVENSDKLLSNQMADDGMALNTSAVNPHFDSLYEDTLAESTESRATVVREQVNRAAFPANSHILVPPKNHTVRNLEDVTAPQGILL
jgi:hypothetical protein